MTTTSAPVTAASLDSPWLTVSEGAVYARCSEDHLRAALASGECRGTQRTSRGRWRCHRDDLDAWLRGEIAPVVVPRVSRRRD